MAERNCFSSTSTSPRPPGHEYTRFKIDGSGATLGDQLNLNDKHTHYEGTTIRECGSVYIIYNDCNGRCGAPQDALPVQSEAVTRQDSANPEPGTSDVAKPPRPVHHAEESDSISHDTNTGIRQPGVDVEAPQSTSCTAHDSLLQHLGVAAAHTDPCRTDDGELQILQNHSEQPHTAIGAPRLIICSTGDILPETSQDDYSQPRTGCEARQTVPDKINAQFPGTAAHKTGRPKSSRRCKRCHEWSPPLKRGGCTRCNGCGYPLRAGGRSKPLVETEAYFRLSNCSRAICDRCSGDAASLCCQMFSLATCEFLWLLGLI